MRPGRGLTDGPTLRPWAALVAAAALAGCIELERLEEESRCGEPGWRLCSGFEGALEPPLVEDVVGEGAAVTVDDGFAYRGRGSLYARAPHTGEGTKAQVFDGSAPSSAAPVEWVRLFFNTPDAAAYDSYLLQVQIAAEPYHGVLVLVEGGRVALRSWSATDYFAAEATTPIESGRWTCVELAAAPEGPVRLWVDGEELAGVSPPAEARAPDLTQLIVGPAHPPSSGPPAEAWFDEIALSDSRIGCER